MTKIASAQGRLGRHVLPISQLTTKGNARRQTRIIDAVLPATFALKRIIHIPPTRARSHHAIAELDLLRRTPFTNNDVFWTLDDGRPAKSQQLTQWIAKKPDLMHARDNLASHGYRVRRFMIAGEQRPSVLADFTRDIAPRAGLWRTLNAGCVIAMIGAALALWLQPAWQAKSALSREALVNEQLREEALELRAEIDALAQIDSERTAFLNSILHRPRAIDALHQLTVALPDSVWASDLVFVEDRITLNAETAQTAADLVLQLTQDDLAYVPALGGPVSRTADGKERFAIVFTAKGGRP